MYCKSSFTSKNYPRRTSLVKRYHLVFPGLIVLGLILAILMISAISRAHVAYAKSDNVRVYQSVQIMPDDTIWDLAVQYSLPDEDPRLLVNQIISLNHLEDTTIVEGSYLIIPVQKSWYDLHQPQV
ncbi:MAG: LysM peptidoglycan-binding domain-containing protein [Firmicutes bacterium]|nr:LysM peptidoglycan-binding domain-containing protein [Bacillota bacterium]